MRDKIFISYSHKDARFRQRLETHLKSLTTSASFWSDEKIEAGDDWEKEIHKAMNEAAVAILLVSADFLASDFIRDIELPALYKAEKENGIIIIPVMLYSCNCGDLMKYQYINTPDKPVGGLKKAKQEEVFAKLSKVSVNKLDEYLEKAMLLEQLMKELKSEDMEYRMERRMHRRESVDRQFMAYSMGTPFGFISLIAVVGAIVGAIIGSILRKTILGGLLGAGIGAIGIFIIIALIVVVILLTSKASSAMGLLIKGIFQTQKRVIKQTAKTPVWDAEQWEKFEIEIIDNKRTNMPQYKISIKPSKADLVNDFADLFANSNFASLDNENEEVGGDDVESE